MKKETRNLIIRKATEDDLDRLSFQGYSLPMVLEDKRKRPKALEDVPRIFILNAGTSDSLSLFRYDSDCVVVLSTNFGLEYAGLQLINLTDGTQDEVFIQNTQQLRVELGGDLERDFFDYSESKQADYLAQWLQ
jgi:hypothetical protein